MKSIAFFCFAALILLACGGQGSVTTVTETTSATITTAPVTTTTTATVTTTSAATTTSSATGGEVVDVFAEDFAFNPSVVTIKVGDSVRWNLSSGSHTTTSGTGTPDGRWNQAIAEEAPVVVTFSEAGEFPYYCRFHPDFMSGQVVVEP